MSALTVRAPGGRHEQLWVLWGLAVVVGVQAGLMLLVSRTEYETWGPIVFFLGLILVTIPLLRWWSNAERDTKLFWILLAALVLKLLAAFVKQGVTTNVYDDEADVGRYHSQALEWYEQIREGDFDLSDPKIMTNRPATTKRIAIIAAGVYAAVPPVKNVGNLFFSWLAFLGLFNIYRAFRIGYPSGDYRRYRLLVFFLPSLLYWPSSIGKDAWIMFCLGFVALGAAHIFAPHPRLRGYAYLIAGTLGVGMVRPHVSLAIVAGFAVAAAFRAKPAEGLSSHRSHAARIAAIALLVVGALVITSQVERFFGEEEFGSFGSESVEAIFDQTVETTEQGGSALDAEPVRSPADIPMAFVTVLFRPFPWEANNLQAFLIGLEGVFLLVLLLTSWKRLRNWLPEARRRPYLMFAMMYSGAFIIAFSNVLNAGILARQRTQMFAFALVAVCVVKDRKATGASRASTDGDGADEAAGGMESAESVVLAD